MSVKKTRAVPAKPNTVMASTFADPKDIARFKACKAEGHTDNFCFSKGDNGIGVWGDPTTTDVPMVALPPEDMAARWGEWRKARLKPVVVIANGRAVLCKVGDRMPWKAKIKNGCGIDLNPAACRALNIKPPAKLMATWFWDEDT